jgi:MFS family permease
VPFIWHGFFLALTMAMIELSTVLPNLIAELTKSNVAFGALYSIMLGAPLIFNLLFSYYMKKFKYKKKFLLFGIYLRSFSFLGMAVFTLLFAKDNPTITLVSFYGLILLFALSGGFAGIAYSDIIGKLLPSEKRPRLYATRQIFNGVASLLGGFIIARIFATGSFIFPMNYVLGMAIGCLGLIFGAFGFWAIKEPPSDFDNSDEAGEGMIAGTLKILKGDRAFRRFILIENITSFSLMILPFYMVFVKHTFADYRNYFGAYVIAQIAGGILSNFMWSAISKRLGTVMVLKVCILTGALIPAVAIALVPMGAVWYVLVFLLTGVITSGRNIGFEPYLLDIAPGDKRTVYLGIRGTLNILVVLLPVAGGLFIDKLGYFAAFATVSVVMLIAFFLLHKGAIQRQT